MRRSTSARLIFATVALLASVFIIGCSRNDCNHASTTESLTPPTHEKEGRTAVMCNDCDYMYYTDYVAPTGHNMKKEIHYPTCTTEGFTYNYCECGYHFNTDVLPPYGHTLSETRTEPTCLEEGAITYICSVCDHSFESPIEALGHDLQVERRFVSVNEQIANSTYTCSRCDLNYIGDHTFYHDIFKGAYVENTDVLAKGLDTSRYQHDTDKDGNYLPLDWSTIKAQGFDFAILKAGSMGTGNVGKIDPVFEMVYRDARAAGIQLGAYFFSYAYSVEDALAEVEFLLTLLEGKTFEYPIFFDIEYSDAVIESKGLTVDELTEICVTFINELQKNGYYAALYTNNKWLTEHLYKDKVVTLFDVWYARYASNTDIIVDGVWNEEKFGPQMAMWQFSHTGIIEGLLRQDGSGDHVQFDMNYAYKDYPTIIKELGYNGFSPNSN